MAVDFYDGAIIYAFENQQAHRCDLDSYRPGDYTLDRERQYGSTRFMTMAAGGGEASTIEDLRQRLHMRNSELQPLLRFLVEEG